LLRFWRQQSLLRNAFARARACFFAGGAARHFGSGRKRALLFGRGAFFLRFIGEGCRSTRKRGNSQGQDQFFHNLLSKFYSVSPAIRRGWKPACSILLLVVPLATMALMPVMLLMLLVFFMLSAGMRMDVNRSGRSRYGEHGCHRKHGEEQIN
jgi:hypothetical protein